MSAFITDHRDRFGVEPICRVLTEHGVKIAPSTYYASLSRPASARTLRDAEVFEHGAVLVMAYDERQVTAERCYLSERSMALVTENKTAKDEVATELMTA